MQHNRVLLLQSKGQVRNNNAREVADAFEKLFNVILPSYPELNRNACEEFVKNMRMSEISRGKKRKALSWLEMGIKHPWALSVVEMDLSGKKLPKRRRIN